MIKIRTTNWKNIIGKTIIISCDRDEIISMWKIHGKKINTETHLQMSNQSGEFVLDGCIWTQDITGLNHDIIWINPKLLKWGFSGNLVEVLAHELRHSRHPDFSEEEITNKYFYPKMENMEYPKLAQLLWENYFHLIK